MTTLVQVRPGFWRVLHQRGQLLGYVEKSLHTHERYAARRVSSVTRAHIPVGDFARLDDAIECFR